MKKPVARFTTAAMVIASVTLGLCQLPLPCPFGVVRAEEKKEPEKKEPKEEETGRGFTARQRQSQTQPGMSTPMEMTTMIRDNPKYGHRADSYQFGRLTMSIYTDYVAGKTTVLFHSSHQYTCRNRPQGTRPAGQAQDPRPTIQKALAGAHNKLGRRTIDGVEAEGIEVREPTAGHKANFKIDSVVSQYWSSLQTGCPILVEQAVSGNNGAVRIKMTTDQFRWNVAFDPNEFKCKIPADYTEMTLPKL